MKRSNLGIFGPISLSNLDELILLSLVVRLGSWVRGFALVFCCGPTSKAGRRENLCYSSLKFFGGSSMCLRRWGGGNEWQLGPGDDTVVRLNNRWKCIPSKRYIYRLARLLILNSQSTRLRGTVETNHQRRHKSCETNFIMKKVGVELCLGAYILVNHDSSSCYRRLYETNTEVVSSHLPNPKNKKSTVQN